MAALAPGQPLIFSSRPPTGLPDAFFSGALTKRGPKSCIASVQDLVRGASIWCRVRIACGLFHISRSFCHHVRLKLVLSQPPAMGLWRELAANRY